MGETRAIAEGALIPSERCERAQESFDEAAALADRVGPYRLLALVGRGGMGDVYRAVRDDDQFKKVVAVKVVRPDAARAPSAERLRSERQILACLDHPGIARLLDGGTMADGRPYLVMEFVEGVRLDAFAETHGLDVRARVEIFRAVCAAVQHAHQNLVVHRDLKPANILVTATGEPKLLDFGVATLLGDTTSGDGTATVSPMTPAYASPEQIRGEPVTTASDLYSLGVVLYELVAGLRPHGSSGALFRAAGCEREPERPRAAWRQAQPGAARSQWRGRGREVGSDLDAIVMKALHREPKQRYPTVDALSEDLRRSLVGLPVSAAHDTLAYRARRFAGRNRVAVTLAALAVALAVAFGVNDHLRTRRLARERDRAERVTSFLVDLFRSSDPDGTDGNAVTARQVLDRGAVQIASSLHEEPELRARLLDTLGRAHRGLGLHARAEELYESSLATRRSAGDGGAALARTLVGLGEARYNQGDLEGAEKVHREALALRRRVFGGRSREVAESLTLVAKALRSRTFHLEAVEALLAEAVAIDRELLAPNDLRQVPGLTQLAHLKRDRGDYAGAEALLRECLAIRRLAHGTERPHSGVAGALGNLGIVLRLKADDAAAEETLRAALAMKRAVFGPEHPALPGTQCHLGSLLRERGDFAAAEELLRQAVAMVSRLAPDHSALPQCLADLGTTLCDAGDCAAGEALHRRSIAVTREQLGSRHPVLSNRLAELGDDLRAEGRLAEAETALREALEICREGLPADGPDRADILVGLADVLAARADPRAAESAREGLEIRRRLLPPDHPEVAEAESVLGAALAVTGRFQEAESLLRRAHAALVARRGPRPRAARDAAARMAALYDTTGRADLARGFRARAEP